MRTRSATLAVQVTEPTPGRPRSLGSLQLRAVGLQNVRATIVSESLNKTEVWVHKSGGSTIPLQVPRLFLLGT